MTHDEYQAAEVEWYQRHGQHKDRLARTNHGGLYVIGDACWNTAHPDRTEYIERQMAIAIREST